jgi:hypothetical protein
MGTGWKHDDLAEDLAIAVGPTPFLNVHLGSNWLQEHVQRADVITVKPSYTRFCVAIYEVKVSRADFQGDLRAEKWRGYLSHCHRIFFAVPAGMVKKEEIPPEAGLIVRGPKGWQVQKSAPAREIEIPEFTLLSMIFVRQRLPLRNRNINQKLDAFGRDCSWKRDRKQQARLLGKEIADAYAKREEYERLVDRLESDERSINDKIKVVDEFIQGSLGLPKHSWVAAWEIKRQLEQIKKELQEAAS